MKDRSQIASFFAGKSVFITGATGFVGKATIAKLLRSCPDINELYILMRPKRSSSVERRLRELLDQPIFDSLRKFNPDSLLKVVPIVGDIGYPNLGLSEQDEDNLIKKISIVIHLAADVNFNADLKRAVNTNICGTQRMVQLASKFQCIQAFVYVSTAYCNCELDEISELVYPMDIDIIKLIAEVERMSEENLHDLSPRIRGKKPNTYTFTKAVAEHFLLRERGSLPVCIVRPSIVTATAQDPFPGWVDSVNGASGLILAGGVGILRTMRGDRSKIVDFIPLDFVVNTIIAAAWRLASERSNKIEVYNCCSGTLNPITWEDFFRHTLKFATANPVKQVIWRPTMCFTLNSRWHTLKNMFLQYLPAKTIDLMLTILGKRPVMMRKYKLLQKVSLLLEPFVTREWKFECGNWKTLYHQMCPVDRKVFNLDIAWVKWESYCEDYWNGLRKYILREDESGVVAGRRRLERIRWVQRAILILLIFGLGITTQRLQFQ